MLRIRLQRVGRKNIPAFRLVLTDSKNSTKSGKYKEILGSFDPVNETKAIKADRVTYWMSMGAKPTDTVFNLLVTEKIITGKKINVLPRKSPIKPEQTESPAKEGAPAPVATEEVQTPSPEEKTAEVSPEKAPEEVKA